MPRYVIIGAGAIGVSIAAELTQAGREAVLIARGTQLKAARASGIKYVSTAGEHQVTAAVYGDPGEITLTPDDVLVLATKTQDAEAALALWAQQPVAAAAGSSATAGASLPLVTTQNGLETERAALRHFATVIGGVLGIPASFVEPGVVVCPTAPFVGSLWIGLYPTGQHDLVEQLAEDMRAARFDVEVVAEITHYKNGKLLASATFALDALFAPSPLRDRLSELVRKEANDVFVAGGQQIAELFAGRAPRFSLQPLGKYEYGGNSTWQSLTRAGSVESDYINGEVVLQARLIGRQAPVNAAIVDAIHRAQRDDLGARALADAEIAELFPQLTDDATTGAVLNVG